MEPRVLVFEAPWDVPRKELKLEEVAVMHLDLMEIFLKILPAFRRDASGRISDDTLALLEWRYTLYLQCLEYEGVAPTDILPPWDVAIVWYCHLMSPSCFLHYLWDSHLRDFGLEHRHFPVSRLVTIPQWTDAKSQKMWKKWANRGREGVPYQLWKDQPWPSDKASGGARHSIALLMGMLQPSQTARKEWKPPQYDHPQTRNFKLDLCRPVGESTWTLADWTDVRTGRREVGCSRHSHGDTLPVRSEMCALQPWPLIQDLRETLERQIAFWQVMSRVRANHPEFVERLRSSEGNAQYEKFLRLFRMISRETGRPLSAPLADVRMENTATTATAAVPPTLTVDLLWRTDKLFPGTYWPRCMSLAWRLVGHRNVASPADAADLLVQTRLLWEANNVIPLGHWPDSIDRFLDAYLPDAARGIVETLSYQHKQYILTGMKPLRGINKFYRMVGRVPRTSADGGGGGYSSFGGDGGSSGGDGGGGGCGGG